MAMQSLTFSRPAIGRRTLLGLGALALVATVGASQIGRPDYSDIPANQDVLMHVAYVPVKDLTELNAKSEAAVVGRVVAKGTTKMIKSEGQQPRAFTPLAPPSGLSAEKLDGLKDAPAAPLRSRENVITPPGGIPVTQFTIEVTRSLRGSFKKGDQFTLSQVGGEIQIPLGAGAPTLTRTIHADHDPLLVQGQEQVLFLSRGSDGTFNVAGGPDGRFSLDARRTIQPVDHASPVGLTLKGDTLDALEAKVKVTGGRNVVGPAPAPGQ
jgi:hypothetical protein